jgi:hypothetical protein
MAILFHLEIIFNSLSNNDLCQWPKLSKLNKAAIVATLFSFVQGNFFHFVTPN